MNANAFLAINLIGLKAINGVWFEGGGWGEHQDSKIRCTISSWNPLESIAQAFEVVEKMGEKGFEYEIYNLVRENNKWHSCQFYEVKTGRWYDTIEHKNPATAITLAACKALGWKE